MLQDSAEILTSRHIPTVLRLQQEVGVRIAIDAVAHLRQMEFLPATEQHGDTGGGNASLSTCANQSAIL